MNNLEKYVQYTQPVVKAVNEYHNQFHRLEYFSVSAEDLIAEDSLIEFREEDKYDPEHFNGVIPLVCAQWGEETGASIVLEISPEQRKRLSPEVVDVLSGKYHREHGQVGEDWESTADKTIYMLLDHQYFQNSAGFEPADDYSYASLNNIGDALDFLSHGLGLNYLILNEGNTDLEYILDQ
jgi:hypothetical protein